MTDLYSRLSRWVSTRTCVAVWRAAETTRNQTSCKSRHTNYSSTNDLIKQCPLETVIKIWKLHFMIIFCFKIAKCSLTTSDICQNCHYKFDGSKWKYVMYKTYNRLLYGSLADPRGAPGTRAPPGGPNSFIFMQFSAKNWKIIALLGVGAPPGKILDPPLLCHGYFLSIP